MCLCLCLCFVFVLLIMFVLLIVFFTLSIAVVDRSPYGMDAIEQIAEIYMSLGSSLYFYFYFLICNDCGLLVVNC